MPRTLRILAAIAAFALGACSSHEPATDITLTDQHAKPWSLSSQRGTPLVLYFGFTHCPDTCPTTLAKLAKALAPIPGAKVVFVTLDPQRDTPSVLAKYVARFEGAPIVALTGTQAQIDAVQNDYHIWSQKVPGKHRKGEYDIAHTSLALVIDRAGAIRSTLQDSDTIQQIAIAVQGASE